jgi:hypothetical protein
MIERREGGEGGEVLRGSLLFGIHRSALDE